MTNTETLTEQNTGRPVGTWGTCLQCEGPVNDERWHTSYQPLADRTYCSERCADNAVYWATS